MADSWLKKHNPGVLFDKDTWKGVGQYAKEQFADVKKAGQQLKKNYWDQALGNKNFWGALKTGPDTWREQEQLNYDMGNAALNVPISAAANFIPSVYNTAAGIINPVLSVAGKVGKLDATAKGPQLPYMNNWYNGYDFFKGGTPGAAQTQAALGGMAGGLVVGGGVTRAPAKLGHLNAVKNTAVPNLLRYSKQRAAKGSKFWQGVNSKLDIIDRRAQLVNRYAGREDLIPDYPTAATGLPEMDRKWIFRGVENSGINPNDYEFRGVIPGSAPGRQVPVPRPGFDQKTGKANVGVAELLYTPNGGKTQPLRKERPFLNDTAINAKEGTLYKGYTDSNWYKGATKDNNVSGTGKLAGDQVMFATPDQNLAAKYGNGDFFSVDPSVAINATDSKMPHVTKHLSTIDPARAANSPNMGLGLRIPYESTEGVNRALFHPNATEALIKPPGGSTAYLPDYLYPTSNGDFYHFVRKGQSSRLAPPEYINTEGNRAAINSLQFPKYNGNGYSKSNPLEMRTLKFLRNNIGLGDFEKPAFLNEYYYPLPIQYGMNPDYHAGRLLHPSLPKTTAATATYAAPSVINSTRRDEHK